mmetsp:Transcript_8303/g.17304  ORF Transcript_8303/g.17304 Transcript_8303/m.17304 type:complete len:339 (-) Transcript_8303:202-1218(-)
MTTALDFRDIHQHPPATAQARQPLPADPSWDAHKVYFNERERDVDKKGDEFDDFFVPQPGDEDAAAAAILEANLKQQQDPAAAILAAQAQPETADETLDPLGWPVDAFRSMAERVQSTLTLGGNDDDGDDLNLLRKSDEDDDAAADASGNVLAAIGVDAQQLVEGVQNLFLYGTPTNPEEENQKNQGGDILDKEDRIKMYETTGVDDESSVDEDENAQDLEDWEKDKDVSYVVQSTSNDEEDIVVQHHHNNLDDLMAQDSTEGNTSAVEPAQFSPEIAETTAATTTLPTFTIPKKEPKKKPARTGPLPLLRPPPAEKLQKWEEAKARPLQHLQGTAKK